MKLEEIFSNLEWPANQENEWRVYPDTDDSFWGCLVRECPELTEILHCSGCQQSNDVAVYIGGTQTEVNSEAVNLARTVLLGLSNHIKNLEIEIKDWYIDYIWFPLQNTEKKWYICFGSEHGGDLEFQFTCPENGNVFKIQHVT